MKEIKAYIKSHRLDAVILALHKIADLPGVSVSEVRGLGGRHLETGRDHQLDELAAHAKIEVVCHDGQAEAIIDAIRSAAHTGLRGDGKIYISRVEDAVRIDNGTRGDAAV